MATLSVCIGSSCHLKGSYNVIQTFQQMIEEYHLPDDTPHLQRRVLHEAERRSLGVAVSFEGAVYHVTPEEARSFFRETVLPRAGAWGAVSFSAAPRGIPLARRPGRTG